MSNFVEFGETKPGPVESTDEDEEEFSAPPKNGNFSKAVMKWFEGKDMLTEQDWKDEKLTPHSVMYNGKKYPDCIFAKRRKLIAAGDLEASNRADFSFISFMGEVSSGVQAAQGLVNLVGSGFTTAYDIVKSVKGIIEELGFGPKDTILLFDNVCGSCKLWMRCYNWIKSFDWIEIEAEEGGILKFTTRIPYDWNIIGLGKWHCVFQDRKNNKELDLDVFGGKAPKYSLNLIRVKESKIYAIDPTTLRADIAFQNRYW